MIGSMVGDSIGNIPSDGIGIARGSLAFKTALDREMDIGL